MLSAIVLACDAAEARLATPEAMVMSLGALVPAVVAALVREASIATVAGDAQMAEIAHHAGCALVEAATAAEALPVAIAAAHNPAVLVLRAGCVPEPGFIEELVEFLQFGVDRGALLRQVPRNGLARLFPSLAPAAGLVGPKWAMQGKDQTSLQALARALRPQVVLRCRATRIG
ncbi:MAG TPA: transposase [Beijerinckiaceae bacterium]|nr:transposase [Beijerinckiaceae bacterium]